MGSKANYLEDKIADHIFRTAFSAPGTIYVGLWTAALSDPSTGSTGGEVATGTAYARMGLAQGTAQWTASSGGTVKNTAAITFPTATADWGTITHVGLLDAATTGNLLYWAALDASKIVQNGDTFQFAANALVVAEY